MLSKAGYKSDSCMDGKKTLQMIEQRVSKLKENKTPMYKIVLLDYSMPDMDGPQVCQELRSILIKELIELPYICCVSAYTEASF